jgi:1-aminocyclopropane-1-carboxylate deaminase/D-cysteine desulfhydrase-like pyridoxal-dependent ACC family enzyme
MDEITPVEHYAFFHAKRDDLACRGLGAKARQFGKMLERQPGLPLVVGCSGTSAMQLYLGAMHKLHGRPAVAFVPARKEPTLENAYAAACGVDVRYVKGGYLSTLRKRARDYAAEIGGAVRWEPGLAVEDTAYQAQYLPWHSFARIVVAVGSGACLTGILVAVARCNAATGMETEVVGVQVSPMATTETIKKGFAKVMGEGYPVPAYTLIPPTSDYAKPVTASLPNGVWLDPYYAGKALPYVGAGDLLWITGCRPRACMPPQGRYIP